MDKVQVINKFQSNVAFFEARLKNITDVLETVPAGMVWGHALDQLTDELTKEVNGMWARMEILERINKDGGYPISEYDFRLEIQNPILTMTNEFRRVITHIKDQKTLHRMYSILM
jgi:predicted transcriptional regulator